MLGRLFYRIICLSINILFAIRCKSLIIVLGHSVYSLLGLMSTLVLSRTVHVVGSVDRVFDCKAIHYVARWF